MGDQNQLNELYSLLREADKLAQAGDEQAAIDAKAIYDEIQKIESSSTAEPAAEGESSLDLTYLPPTLAGAGGATGLAVGPSIAKGLVEPVVQAGVKKVPGQGVRNYIAATTEMPFAGGKDYGTAYEKASIAASKPVKSRGSQTPIRRGGLGINTQPEPPSFLRQAGSNLASAPSGQAWRIGSGIRLGAAGSLAGKTAQDIQQGNYGDAALHGTGALATVAGQSRYKPLRALGNVVATGEIASGLSPFFIKKEPNKSVLEGKAAGGAIQGYNAGSAVKSGLSAIQQRLARAPKKSKQEIEAIAERMAPQQLDQFVRAPGKTTSVAGKSLKQFQREQNLKHDIAPGLQGQYSLDALNPIDWNAQKGGVNLILPGDKSGVDIIKGIAGKPLAQESVQEGGFPFALKFAQENPDEAKQLWSSTGRAARGYFDLGKRVADQYGTTNILPIYSSMPEGMEYALHFNDALVQGLKPNKANIKMLDDLMRQGQYKGQSFQDFKGFGDDEYVTQYMKNNPNFRKYFGGRMQVQDFAKSVGLPPTYGSDVLHAVTRPELRNVETGAGGNLIGRLDLSRPHLRKSSHGTYENLSRDPGYDIPGEAIGKTKYITPYEMMFPDSLMAVRANPKQAPQEFGSLKFTGARQIIDNQHVDEMGMYDEAMKRLLGFNQGGPIKGYNKGKKVVDATRKLILPPAENAARTQIIGTLPTYEKAGSILRQQGATGRGIDFGAGLGQGAKALGKDFDTYEPFAKNWTPTYSNAADVPSDAYGQLTNLNVLNVVPREVRDEIVQDIGRVMQPGGMGIITTRGKDVMNAKGLAGPEPMSIITTRDTYQKGFNKDELEDYLKYMLGSGFEIDRLNLGPAGALIKKKADGGLACLKEGGRTPAWQRAEGKNPEGGLNAAGRASYNRETGGNLKAPQPEGGPRKKSFCARMSGMKKKLTSSETANDPDSRINKALRKWKC